MAHVDLDNVSKEQYQQISDYFVPLVNQPKLKSRDAIGRAFVMATEVCPNANPSDLWHHVLYRIYVREKIGTDPSQSWVRTSGEAFEVALVERYNPVLARHGIRLTALFKGQKGLALTRMGVADRVGSRKVDVMIEKQGSGRAPDTEGFGVVGGIHAKVSLAERVSDDIPASRIMMDDGLLSVLSTLDVKSFPPPHGDLVNRGEGQPTASRASRKTAVGLAWPTRRVVLMTDWTETELSALRRAYASGTTRVSYDGKSVDYGSAEDLLSRIRTIERAIAGTTRPLPIAGLAGFSRGDR